MRVGIVGAGLSGLAAARELAAAGHDVVIIEKSRGLGGRIASRRIGDAVVDHGAPVIDAEDGSALAAAIGALPGDELVTLDGPPGVRRFAYRSGATRLAKLLADGIPVITGARLAALRASSAGLELAGEQGNTHGVVDAVIVTAPAPQAADLLENSPEPAVRVAALREARYDPAIMILAGMRIGAPMPFEPPAPAGPLARVTVESAKGRDVAGDVVPVVGMIDAAESARLLDGSDEDVLAVGLPALAEALGTSVPPAWVQVKRWRYAQIAEPCDPNEVNPPGRKILVCGDCVAGAGLSEVYDSGVAAARRVMDDG